MRAHRSTSTVVAVVVLALLALQGTGTHTVRWGETLGGIAADHGTTVGALAAANDLADPDVIQEGRVLVLPGSSTGSTSYVVRPGDTLSHIAARHGSSVSSLVAANRLPDPHRLRIGQVLTLPAARGTAVTAVSPPAGGATTYVVRPGDTVGAIAARFRIPQGQLTLANGLSGARIYAGQHLRLVPAAGARAAGAGMRCPVTGPVTFVNDWGFPRSGGRSHEGNDLFAPRGRPVVATVSGLAVPAIGGLGGNQVRLYGDDGVGYFYTHLDRFGHSGRVSAGTVVGYVGATGNAAGGPPHLHFELHPGGGAAVNPYPRLREAC